MPCKNIEIPCLCIPVIQIHGIVQRKIVACKAASYDSGMSREHGSYRKPGPLDIEKARPRHPLVELCHYLVRRTEVMLVETFDDPSCGIAEKG